MFLAVAAILPEGCTKNGQEEDTQDKKEQPTVNVRATIAIPSDVTIPSEVEDSLTRWLGEILNVPVYGDDGRYNNKVLLYLEADRDWEDGKPETWSINLRKTSQEFPYSTQNAIYYNHEIADSLEDVIKIEKQQLNGVQYKNGESDSKDGIVFYEGEKRILAHSNGKDKITLYLWAKTVLDNGMKASYYKEIGTIESGYFYGIDENGNKTLDPESGYNVLLRAFSSPESKEYYTGVKGRVMDVKDITRRAGSKIVIGDEIDR